MNDKEKQQEQRIRGRAARTWPDPSMSAGGPSAAAAAAPILAAAEQPSANANARARAQQALESVNVVGLFAADLLRDFPPAEVVAVVKDVRTRRNVDKPSGLIRKMLADGDGAALVAKAERARREPGGEADPDEILARYRSIGIPATLDEPRASHERARIAAQKHAPDA